MGLIPEIFQVSGPDSVSANLLGTGTGADILKVLGVNSGRI